MTSQITAFPLRMPEHLRAWFEQLATDNGRSLNSEIVQKLKEIHARSGAAEQKEGGNIE